MPDRPAKRTPDAEPESDAPPSPRPASSAGVQATSATDAGSAQQTLDQSNQQTPGTGSPAEVEGDPVKAEGYFSDDVSADQDHAPAPETPGQTGQAFVDPNASDDK